MKKKKELTVVPCSDWWLGWGYGGYDHLGRLYKMDDNTFEWRGNRQGRHGRIIRSRYTVKFTLKELMSGSPVGLPSFSEVKKALIELGVDI